MRDKRGRWAADWRDPNGHRHRRVCPDFASATALSNAQAAATLAARRRTLSIQPCTLADAADRWIAAAGHKEEQRRRRYVLRAFLDVAHPDAPVHTLSADHIGALLRRERDRKASPHALFDFRWRTLRFLRWCHLQGWHPEHIVLRGYRQPRPAPRISTITASDVKRLATAAPPLLRRAILLAAELGLSAAEIVQVRVADLEGNWLNVPVTKARQPRRLWLTTRLRRILRAPAQKKTHRAKRADRLVPLNPQQLRRSWMPLVATLQLAGVRLHDLRHFFATRLARNGESAHTIAALLGHRTLTSALWYVRLTSPDLDAAMQRLTSPAGTNPKRVATARPAPAARTNSTEEP